MDPDKPSWQRGLALEILHRMLAQPLLVKSFCQSYDMKPHATNIFQDTVNSLAACIQSLFVTTPPGQVLSGVVLCKEFELPYVDSVIDFYVGQGPAATTAVSSIATVNSVGMGPGISPQAGFYYRGVWIPICSPFTSGQPKATL